MDTDSPLQAVYRMLPSGTEFPGSWKTPPEGLIYPPPLSGSRLGQDGTAYKAFVTLPWVIQPDAQSRLQL